MYYYLVIAIVFVAIGAYGMLLAVSLCAVSASADRRVASPPKNVDSAANDSSTCSLCERTVTSGSRLIRKELPSGLVEVGNAGPSIMQEITPAKGPVRAELPTDPH